MVAALGIVAFAYDDQQTRAGWENGPSIGQGAQNPLQDAGLALATSVAPALSTSPHRKRRVVFYAIYSTDEQNPHSIEDQFAKCRLFVTSLGLGEIEVTVFSDPGVSGEHVSRPGIDQVKQLIDKKACDLVVALDCSRLFRHTTAAMRFFESAVDNDIRVVTINDRIANRPIAVPRQ